MTVCWRQGVIVDRRHLYTPDHAGKSKDRSGGEEQGWNAFQNLSP